MTRLLRNRRVLVPLAAVVVAAMAVAAWAYWKTTGAGTAAASIGTLSAPGKPTTSVAGATITVSWSAASVSGGGTVKYHVERRPSSGSTWTDVCGSSDAAPITAVSCADTPAFNTYVYRVTARFGSWHTTGPESDPVTPTDATPPSFGSPAVSLSTSGGSAFYTGSGTSVYYNGTSDGSSSITVSAPNVADADSGIAKVNFPAPAGFSGGGDDLASPFSATYTWSSSSASGSQTLTATNGAGGTATTTFSLVRDVTAPTGGAVTVAGSSTNGATVNNTTASYTIAGLAQYAETQSGTASGLASSSLVRDEAGFNVDGSCGTTFTNATTISANRTENSGTGIASGRCYRYTLKGIDKVGNSASIQITVKVDTTGPSFGSPALSFLTSGGAAYYPGSGTSVYYNGNTGAGTGSSFIVSAPNVADADSGIAKVNFPSPSGFSGGGDDLISPFAATYTWTTSSATGSQTVTGTNGAGSTATTTFSLVRDVTAPTGGALTVAGSSTNGATVNNNSASYTISGLTQYTETQTASAAGLLSSSLVREESAYNPDGTCSATWVNATTISATRTENSGTGITSGHCYRYTLKGTDQVANSASVQITVKVDTQAPTATNVVLANGGTAGRLGQADTVTIDYSEALDATSICSTFANDGNTQSRSGSSVTVTVTNNGTNDSLTVSTSSGCTMHVGTVALGADYVTANKTYSGSGGNASIVEWDPTARQVTITLGSGTAGEKTGVTASTPSYTPDAAIKDLMGNVIASGPFTGSSSAF